MYLNLIINSKLVVKCMAKVHDENKDLRSVSRVCHINYSNKVISCPRSTVLGIRMLGKLDYLTHYCGWVFHYDNAAKASFITNDSNATSSRAQKKEKKEPKLTNKTKKVSKKK